MKIGKGYDPQVAARKMERDEKLGKITHLNEDELDYIEARWRNGVKLLDLALEFRVVPDTLRARLKKRGWTRQLGYFCPKECKLHVSNISLKSAVVTSNERVTNLTGDVRRSGSFSHSLWSIANRLTHALIGASKR